MSITKIDAIKLQHGDVLHHVKAKNADGTPARCRVTGKCKTWETDPKRFRLPVKHGMYQSFYIDNDNGDEWYVAD